LRKKHPVLASFWDHFTFNFSQKTESFGSKNRQKRGDFSAEEEAEKEDIFAQNCRLFKKKLPLQK